MKGALRFKFRRSRKAARGCPRLPGGDIRLSQSDPRRGVVRARAHRSDRFRKLRCRGASSVHRDRLSVMVIRHENDPLASTCAFRKSISSSLKFDSFCVGIEDVTWPR